jgi:Family of unknown function (DUF6052)
MNEEYAVPSLTDGERTRLQRVYEDLQALADSSVPSVRATARAAIAHVAQALNGQDIRYELYTKKWLD